MFGAGGMLAALLGPMLVWITGLAVPLGFTLSADLFSYAHVHALAQSLIGKGALFVVIALFGWHAAHRIFHSLHDIGIHPGPAAKLCCYGSAFMLTLVLGWSLLAIGF
jgi:fumarate reductase subunit D